MLAVKINILPAQVVKEGKLDNKEESNEQNWSSLPLITLEYHMIRFGGGPSLDWTLEIIVIIVIILW